MIWDTTVQIQTGKTPYGKKEQKKNGNCTTNTYKNKTHTKITTYDELEIAIKQALTKTIGKKVINTSIKTKNSKEIKRAKTDKKIARKEFEEAIEYKQNNIKKKLYIKTQETLRTIIEQ